MHPILKVENLEKSHSSSFHLGPINFELKGGDCLGVLGKNGAGKTTLFQLITGSSDAKGKSKILLKGEILTPEKYQLKRKIGYMPQNLHLPRWVNAHEILNYACKLYNIADAKNHIMHALRYWDCIEFAHRPVAACSHGMQKRIALALATIHEPPLLILDEPFSGLDIFHTKALQDAIINRQQAGLATIICTHIAPYAAAACNSITFIDGGKQIGTAGWSGKNYLERIKVVENFFYHAKDQ